MRFQNHFMHAAERHPSGHLTPAQRTSSLEFPVAVVNLLRKGSIDRDRSEARLYSAFCDLMTALSRGCGMNIINIGLDWHELSATHGGLAPVVQILWGATENNMKSFGFSEGVFEEAKAPDPANDEAPWGKNMLSRRTRRQQVCCPSAAVVSNGAVVPNVSDVNSVTCPEAPMRLSAIVKYYEMQSRV